MKPIVACFAGRIAIGKTSISKAVAKQLHWPWTGFGDYVRAVATKRGLDSEDRYQLQEIGESLIREHGFEWFCKEVISNAKWTGDSPLVIDGIRHVEAFETIRGLLSSHLVLLIYLLLNSEEALHTRAMLRGIDVTERRKWETHSTEEQVLSTLPGIANLVVPADLPESQVTAEIISFLVDTARR